MCEVIRDDTNSGAGCFFFKKKRKEKKSFFLSSCHSETTSSFDLAKNLSQGDVGIAATAMPCPKQVEDKSVVKLLDRLNTIETSLREHRLASSPGLVKQLAAQQQKQALLGQIKVRAFVPTMII